MQSFGQAVNVISNLGADAGQMVLGLTDMGMVWQFGMCSAGSAVT